MHGAPQDVTGLSQESKNAADSVPFLRGCPESENKQQLILENSRRVCPCLEKEPEEGPGKRRHHVCFVGPCVHLGTWALAADEAEWASNCQGPSGNHHGAHLGLR